jgi:hypothetical protein
VADGGGRLRNPRFSEPRPLGNRMVAPCLQSPIKD